MAAVLGLLVEVGVASPAQAADRAPTNVKVAWANAAHTHVRVTWSETGSVPNQVFPQYAGGLGGGKAVTAAAGNQFTMKWHAGADPVDPNPGDPLDLPLGPHRFQVYASLANVTISDLVADAGAATSATFTPHDAAPIAIGVRDSNEWSNSFATDGVDVDVERIGGVSFPVATMYGQPTVITGALQRLTRRCDPGPCWAEPIVEPSRPVVLQARADAASPWYVVGIVQSAGGTFRFAPVAWGTREYRVAVPDQFANGSLGLGVISGASTTLTRPGVTGGFTDSTATYGQQVTTQVKLAPPANVRRRCNGGTARPGATSSGSPPATAPAATRSPRRSAAASRTATSSRPSRTAAAR
ncbi:hypothetical protein [Kribbella sp. DT2]|uniref:hypothetical protein n=1 Tax=Kribbella sp. DT2 TaxID=3393427 RepID=UPI003CEBC8C5